MNIDIKDKRVLVTGSSKGIGFEIARTFAQEGAQPILASRDGARLKEVADTILTDTGISCETIPMDLSAPGASDAVMKAWVMSIFWSIMQARFQVETLTKSTKRLGVPPGT